MYEKVHEYIEHLETATILSLLASASFTEALFFHTTRYLIYQHQKKHFMATLREL